MENPKKRQVIKMREMDNVKITKELAEEVLNTFVFVDTPDLEKYDYFSINSNNDLIEILKEERYERIVDDTGEDWEYKIISKEIIRLFKKNSISGVFVEV